MWGAASRKHSCYHGSGSRVRRLHFQTREREPVGRRPRKCNHRPPTGNVNVNVNTGTVSYRLTRGFPRPAPHNRTLPVTRFVWSCTQVVVGHQAVRDHRDVVFAREVPQVLDEGPVVVLPKKDAAPPVAPCVDVKRASHELESPSPRHRSRPPGFATQCTRTLRHHRAPTPRAPSRATTDRRRPRKCNHRTPTDPRPRLRHAGFAYPAMGRSAEKSTSRQPWKCKDRPWCRAEHPRG